MVFLLYIGYGLIRIDAETDKVIDRFLLSYHRNLLG
jgi:hypothetical protein